MAQYVFRLWLFAIHSYTRTFISVRHFILFFYWQFPFHFIFEKSVPLQAPPPSSVLTRFFLSIQKGVTWAKNYDILSIKKN